MATCTRIIAKVSKNSPKGVPSDLSGRPLSHVPTSISTNSRSYDVKLGILKVLTHICKWQLALELLQKFPKIPQRGYPRTSQEDPFLTFRRRSPRIRGVTM